MIRQLLFLTTVIESRVPAHRKKYRPARGRTGLLRYGLCADSTYRYGTVRSRRRWGKAVLCSAGTAGKEDWRGLHFRRGLAVWQGLLHRHGVPLDFSDMGFAQIVHTDTGLSDPAADGIRQFFVQQGLLERKTGAVFTSGKLELSGKCFFIDTDSHGGEFQSDIQNLIVDNDISVQFPVIIVRGTAVMLFTGGKRLFRKPVFCRSVR